MQIFMPCRTSTKQNTSLRCARQRTTRDHRICGCRGVGRDVARGFFDLADLVASDKARKGMFDELAYTIGREAFADLNGWHLFLKDMSSIPGGPKMHALLAEQLGTQIMTDGFDERDVEDFLKKIPVELGQGKTTVSLDSVLPAMAVDDIVKACKEFERDCGR